MTDAYKKTPSYLKAKTEELSVALNNLEPCEDHSPEHADKVSRRAINGLVVIETPDVRLNYGTQERLCDIWITRQERGYVLEATGGDFKFELRVGVVNWTPQIKRGSRYAVVTAKESWCGDENLETKITVSKLLF